MNQPLALERAREIADDLTALRGVEVVRFFGGAGLVIDGVQFAFVMKGSLYFRVDDQTRAEYEARGAAPFTYDAHRKRVKVASYYEAPSEAMDDTALLGRFAADAYRAACAAGRTPKAAGVHGRGRRTSPPAQPSTRKP